MPGALSVTMASVIRTPRSSVASWDSIERVSVLMQHYESPECLCCVGARAQSQSDLDIFAGAGPIFLTDLLCDASDNTLLDCTLNGGSTTHNTLGLTRCDHDQDIGVECVGTYVRQFNIHYLAYILYVLYWPWIT